MAKSKSIAARNPPALQPIPAKPQLPKHIAEAISEQQSRVWRLRNLIQCVRETDADMVDDLEAALSGLVEYADDIHQEMDAQLVAERASEIGKRVAAAPGLKLFT